MTLNESTYFDFTLFLAQKGIDYAECKTFKEDIEIVLVVPKRKHKERRFYVESGKQIL